MVFLTRPMLSAGTNVLHIPALERGVLRAWCRPLPLLPDVGTTHPVKCHHCLHLLDQAA